MESKPYTLKLGVQVVRGVVLARKGLEVPVQQITSLQEGARLLPSDAYRSCLSRVGSRVHAYCATAAAQNAEHRVTPSVPQCFKACVCQERGMHVSLMKDY